MTLRNIKIPPNYTMQYCFLHICKLAQLKMREGALTLSETTWNGHACMRPGVSRISIPRSFLSSRKSIDTTSPNNFISLLNLI